MLWGKDKPFTNVRMGTKILIDSRLSILLVLVVKVNVVKFVMSEKLHRVYNFKKSL